MEKMLASLGLKYLAAKLDGKKTIFGAIILILLGIGKIGMGGVLIIAVMFPENLPPEIVGPVNIDSAWEFIQTGAAIFGTGLMGLGIGHKVQKATN